MASQDPRAKGAEDLQFEKCLGRGYFGEVWQAQTKSDHKAVAVKKVRLQLILENQLLDQLKREVNILYSLQHPRIVRLYFHFEDKYFVYLGMEFCIGGSLFDKLQKAEKFTGQRAATYFLQTCEALDYLHHLPDKVIHRDIKPENILLDANDSAKLADFGWANLLEQDKRSTFCGTLDYLAPEMIRGTGHDESVDMWTMGVLLYEMLTGQSPFGSQSKETTCKRIVHVDLLFPSDMNQSGRDLIGKLCRKNPTERFKVREAMAHEFVVRFHGTEAGETSISHGGYPPGAEKGITAAGDEDLPRPSVVARKLRSECEKLGGEKEHLMQAIQNMEDQIQKQKDLLLDAEAAIQNVRKERREAEALKQEQLKRCDELARKIEDKRRKEGRGSSRTGVLGFFGRSKTMR
mmetsp:Transcript_44624/g.104248  ORF Transcript_44624/g.104248 Transcript_44624/m.104248 type:complete len:405 (+) Transcript_44624:38-1252(+)